MLRLFLLISALLVSLASSETYGYIQIPSIMYVKPGDDFTIPCSSDYAVVTKLFLPGEGVPPEEEKERIAANDSFRKKNTAMSLFENASKEEHEGIYTCLVNHGADFDRLYSEATCQVIVVDLCEASNCSGLKTCVPDYSKGTFECACDYACPMDFNALCADTCDLYWNECAMEETSCQDGIMRNKMSDGFCPAVVAPATRKAMGVQTFTPQIGDTVYMSSGLIEDGTPAAVIVWYFNDVLMEGVGGDLEIVASEDTAGEYTCTITHCRNEAQATVNKYKIEVDVVTEEPTEEDVDDYEVFLPRYTCTMYPGGVIETFSSASTILDLACSHVLAADLGAASGYTSSWYIYGVYDSFQGQPALHSMTFYVGGGMWEVQRGWLVNMNGAKWALQETGVAQAVPGTDCFITFANWHVNVTCPGFEAYYDGIMSGHIVLTRAASDAPAVKMPGSEFGLCFDDAWGSRPNWQVGVTTGKCELNLEREACTEGAESCLDLFVAQTEGEAEWKSCGGGAVAGCGEVTCGVEMTEMQSCALDQARDLACAMKRGESRDEVRGASCPVDECDWFLAVVAEGCPQYSFPFQCGEVDQA